MDVEALLEQLTMEEKVALTAGRSLHNHNGIPSISASNPNPGVGWWHTATIERLGIDPIRLSGDPDGVRGTHLFDSTPSACLPCRTAIGATFDVDLVTRLGRLLSDEAHAKGAHVLLGPIAVGHTGRSPCGRSARVGRVSHPEAFRM